MSEADFETVRGCLNGEIHWEGVGPRPWWAPFDRIRARVEELEREVEVLTKQSDDWQTEASRFEAALTRRALGEEKS